MGARGSGRKPSPIQPTTLAAARVLEYCNDNSLYHSDVARALGVDVGNFRKVLCGERRPSLEVAVAVEEMLNIPVRQWVEELANPPIIVQE